MLPPILDQIIQALAGFASPIIKDKIQRSETVIRLLRQFKLDPEHPPSDFTGVYVYALVGYGVGKSRQLLEIFRQEEIKQAFRRAFDHNNPSILLFEVDTFLDSCGIGNEIRNLGVDVRREVAEFATLFTEVAKQSRTPSDVLMSHQLGSLHQRITNIQEQLSRLPNLEGIRIEIARLAAESYPTLPGASATKGNNSKATALAQQMRAWFETLGYKFEKNYEVWSDNYFEWIIHIPIRRARYDRVLVRGITGEVGLSDVIALRQSVETQLTDEGWLITARRISRAARLEVEKEGLQNLGCYTFDELLAQDIGFNGYLDWLEAEVKGRKIDTNYVPLSCNKEEIDPITKRTIGVSRYSEEDGWIEGYIDRWLDDPAKEHLSILGEFGTGKTWFALHYAWVTLQRYRDSQKRGTELPRIPLIISLRDYTKAVSVESLFSEFFFRKHKIPLPHYDAFVQLNHMGKLLLIFDGFDEMAAKVDKQQMINNFWELAKIVVPGAKVILTCRTEYFPEAKEGRALLNAELQASTANLTGETPQFEILELEKFNDDQIRQLLSHQAETATIEKVMGNPQLLDLARRPVMTEFILEALPDIEAGKPVDMSRVYLYAVRRKMERDIKAERTFTSLADKLYFLCELSWEMLSTNQMSLNYKLFPDRIRRLFGVVEKDLDHWHFDMMGQTMLIRNANGDYTPAHRSLLEFFVAYKFAASLGALAPDFTQLAQEQSNLKNDVTPVDYTWSSYFHRQVNVIGEIISTEPLKKFESESLLELRETFGQAKLTKVLMDLLLPMLDISIVPTYSVETKNNLASQKDSTNSSLYVLNSLLEVLTTTRGKTETEVGYVGGNAATLLVKLNKTALEDKDLSSAVIIGADFSNATLHGANFAKANLTNSIFPKVLGSVLSVAFSPDGKLFATGDSDGVVRLWETASGREIWTYKGHSSWVNSVAFSPDSTTLASASGDQTVRLWDTNSGKPRNTLHGHTDWVNFIAFSPDGTNLASGSRDHTVRLWNINSGECYKILQEHTNWVNSVAFSPDGTTLASGSRDYTVRLWNINSGKCYKILQEHTNWVRSVAFSPDGTMLASASNDKTVRVWNIKNGKCRRALQGHTNWVRSVAFSPDSAVLASASDDQTVRLWDIESGECSHTLLGHTNWVNCVAFTSNGTTLASASGDQTVRLWNVSSGECFYTLHGYTNWVRSISFNPDGMMLASGSGDQTVRLWNISSGECLYSLDGHTNCVNSVAFSPDGAMLASASGDQTVRLWSITAASGKCLHTLHGHTDWVHSIVFSPDGAMLASGSSDQTVRVWDVSTGKYRYTLGGHTNWVNSVAFSPNGKRLASGSDDQTVRLWDVESGEADKILHGHTSWVSSVAFSPDGSTLASGSDDQTVRLWDIKSGKCLHILPEHSNWVRSITFSPDGATLASASDDQTVRLWDIKSGKCLCTLQEHNNWVRSIAFSPDGTKLASASGDQTIKLWNISTGKCLKTFTIDRLYEGMNITGVKGLTEEEIATLKALGAVED